MKVCKKIALIAIMFILLSTLNVYAGIVEVTSTVSSREVKVGDTVTVTLAAKFGTGIEGIDATLDYDTTKLKLTNESALAASDFTSMSGTNDATGDFKLSVLYTGSGAAPTEATFATLTFEVLNTVTVSETLTIKLSEMEIGDSDDNWVELDDQTITLTVIEENTTCEHNYEMKHDENEHWEACTKCGEEKANSRGAHTAEVTKAGKEPTCEQTGLTEEKSCKDCGRILQQQTTIAATGHNYENGECTGCGEKEPGDGTGSGEDYPYAGLADNVFIILAVAAVAIIGYRKVKEYSDIK